MKKKKPNVTVLNPKKHNPTDATMRNVRAAKKRTAKLTIHTEVAIFNIRTDLDRAIMAIKFLTKDIAAIKKKLNMK